MALGDPYIEGEDLDEYLGIDDAHDAAQSAAAGRSASQWVTNYCARDFNKTDTATARVFHPATSGRVDVDDFWTTAGLIVATDDGNTGTYGTTWTAGDYALRPVNGYESPGIGGFPFRSLTAVESRSFPCGTRPRVQVTAKWGWAAVPESVVFATKIVAALYFNLKDSPLGIASFADGGIIRVRDVPQAAMLLEPYRQPARTGPFLA